MFAIDTKGDGLLNQNLGAPVSLVGLRMLAGLLVNMRGELADAVVATLQLLVVVMSPVMVSALHGSLCRAKAVVVTPSEKALAVYGKHPLVLFVPLLVGVLMVALLSFHMDSLPEGFLRDSYTSMLELISEHWLAYLGWCVWSPVIGAATGQFKLRSL